MTATATLTHRPTSMREAQRRSTQAEGHATACSRAYVEAKSALALLESLSDIPRGSILYAAGAVANAANACLYAQQMADAAQQDVCRLTGEMY